MTSEEIEELQQYATNMGMNFVISDKFCEIQYAVMNYHIIDSSDNLSVPEVKHILHNLSKRDVVALPLYKLNGEFTQRYSG